ncbi:SigE family RNA polymerase sigma factor [Motilibacter aurantiacus]|uniref:SigE family RNA polymerase sigma factor n=1 Tax=Motilibacter aurantiacus TaxID=2714955 RepID=UPI00140D0192|nr:SigE family RNA polymerase sigma factor [Motilibacter aurantiacus]NHC45971.1 SigE family RNA polymerase sigma factor [Motilibacter aurantiacus]
MDGRGGGFDEYATARGPALLRFAYALTGHREQAEDLLQTALADAYVHWRKVLRADDPDAYVRRMMLNRFLGWRRRRWSGELASEHVDPGASPDPAGDVVERDAVRRALATLPPRQRAVVVLRYLEDLDDAAIAATLGVSPGSVRVTAHRALAALRRRLPPDLVLDASAPAGKGSAP